jgi:hypothetical protein
MHAGASAAEASPESAPELQDSASVEPSSLAVASYEARLASLTNASPHSAPESAELAPSAEPDDESKRMVASSELAPASPFAVESGPVSALIPELFPELLPEPLPDEDEVPSVPPPSIASVSFEFEQAAKQPMRAASAQIIKGS